MNKKEILISKKEAGQRLDHFLSEFLSESRSKMQKEIKNGRVSINDKTIKKTGQKLQEKDKIIYKKSLKKENKHSAEEIHLDILFENENLIVINKDPGIVVHPDNTGHHSGTIVNALLAHQKELSPTGNERPGIVHRLDKDTSGALIIAKNEKTHQKLSEAFQNREVGKIYITLAKGHFKTKEGRIEAAIKRDSKSRKRMAINPQGKMALTQFKVLEEFEWKTKTSKEKASLLEVQIETGRTHQIRLHLASIGHPVAGDILYGEEAFNKNCKNLGLKRQFLHAKSLQVFQHNFEASLKDDLKKVLDELRN